MGTVLEPYSVDNQFHMLGFGGAPNYMDDQAENGKTLGCWNLNGKPYDKILGGKVTGTQEMLRTYHRSVM